MRRRTFLSHLLASGALTLAPRLGAADGEFERFHDFDVDPETLVRLNHPAEYWRRYLDEPAWQVLFREDTEPPFSSPLNTLREDGTYVCAACHLPLFSSATQYDSGTGWPSFWQPHEPHIGTKRDFKLLWPRTEYHCVRCGGHQGHVFNDGPEPTGRRWCNNGLALNFVPSQELLPGLRG